MKSFADGLSFWQFYSEWVIIFFRLGNFPTGSQKIAQSEEKENRLTETLVVHGGMATNYSLKTQKQYSLLNTYYFLWQRSDLLELGVTTQSLHIK